jgi:hypothetical protein
MSERFEWVPDLTRGEWLRPMEAEPFGSILSVVPRGFEMYARVFHPVERDRPRTTKTWQGLDEATYFTGVQDIEASLETESATWAEAAASFETIMHAEAQYARLVRRDYGNVDGAIAADGWRYGDTREGCLDAVSLAAAAAVLARHTTTPDAGIAAVWDGWGGLVSSAGLAYLELSDGAPPATPTRMLRTSPIRRCSSGLSQPRGRGLPGRDRYSRPVRGSPPTSRNQDPGCLPVRSQPGRGSTCTEDTGRNYVLFEAGANDFADAAWPAAHPG